MRAAKGDLTGKHPGRPVMGPGRPGHHGFRGPSGPRGPSGSSGSSGSSGRKEMTRQRAETIEHQPGEVGTRRSGRLPGSLGPLRATAGGFIRRHKLVPYLLLLPALAGIALVLLWPLVQVGLFSFQNYSLMQVTGVAPTQWVGPLNFTSTFKDPEFWLSLRTTVLLAAVVVPATLLVGTVVGLLLNRLGKQMAGFVSTAALS